MTSRDVALYHDCCDFWKRMGVKKEDNIIAFALADMILVCKKDFRLDDWDSYYKEVYDKCRIEAMKSKYNERRGREGFLAESGL